MAKRIYLLLILGFMVCAGHAQLVDKKLNVNINYHGGDFFGKKMSDTKGFVYPRLFSNMSELTGYSLKTLWKWHPKYSVGLEFDRITGDNWNVDDYLLYSGSVVNMISFSPVIQMHSRFQRSGTYNRLKFFGEVGPVIGQSKLSLRTPIFENDYSGDEHYLKTKGVDNFFGINVGAGVEYYFSSALGLHFSCSLQNNFIKPELYNDQRFFYGRYGIGLIYRFVYEKRFTY
ncbi:outer membrane protein beta-barrel domain [Bacteroidales bacterium 6E]|nr:outer membrane protein beta-barrel domain [Bacteroidales bacterium 6E]